jgi:hypothetical protein
VTDKQLLVYVDLDGESNLVGRLWARARKGNESATFEYDASWLTHRSRFALETRAGTRPRSAAHGSRAAAVRGRWRFGTRSLGSASDPARGAPQGA